MEHSEEEYINIKVTPQTTSGLKFRFRVPKNITMDELRMKISKRKSSPMVLHLRLRYRDEDNDVIELENDEDLDCALKRGAGFVKSVNYLCVLTDF
ncbi:hypothetical protein INT45_009838 [Circinella minor]|uniref:PB1 domain-containing protein n=1 Tax=Circinella minor TaxID=1195481 RepID=A0A8H7VJ15_9FUNG|nr:hypothetical protein INT45_009838 [Circinella minor]